MTPETQLRLQPHAPPLLSTASWHSLLPCPTTPRQASQGRWPLGCDSKSLDLALYSIVRFGVRQKHKTPSSQSPILYLNYLLATCPAHVLQPNSQTHRNTHCFWEPATHQHSVCLQTLAWECRDSYTHKHTCMLLIAHTHMCTHSLTRTPHFVNTPTTLTKMHMVPKYAPSLTLNRNSPNLCTHKPMHTKPMHTQHANAYVDTHIHIYIFSHTTLHVQSCACTHTHHRAQGFSSPYMNPPDHVGPGRI